MRSNFTCFRQAVPLFLYRILIILILTVLPLSSVVKRLLKPLLKENWRAKSAILLNRQGNNFDFTTYDVYINRVAAFLPNEPVTNDQMEQVLGMIGNTPSRVRKMILRSNAIKRVIMQLIQKPRNDTY